jgi:hypothetical protein
MTKGSLSAEQTVEKEYQILLAAWCDGELDAAVRTTLTQESLRGGCLHTTNEEVRHARE